MSIGSVFPEGFYLELINIRPDVPECTNVNVKILDGMLCAGGEAGKDGCGVSYYCTKWNQIE